MRVWIAVGIILLVVVVPKAQPAAPPFRVEPLFDHSKPETLGLLPAPGLETFTIFSPSDTAHHYHHYHHYHHGVVLYPFKGMLYAQWQSSAKDEDEPGTCVYYSRSADGKNWSHPQPLTKAWSGGITTSGGWWSTPDTLIAYINTWPSGELRQGFTNFLFSADGITWSDPKPVTDIRGVPVQGIIEQDVRVLPSGRLLTAFHVQPGLRATPYFTDMANGISGWQAGVMPHLNTDAKSSRALEPSWFLRKDGAVVMIFRDQQGTYKKLASVSYDSGATWTLPEIINTPDSRAKQSAGNLPGGAAFMVNNPSGNRDRFPLVITLSGDGFVFDRAWLLRQGGKELPALRYPGKYKRPGYSYPKSVLWNGYLYVGYATNKEDVEVTRVPINTLMR